MIHVRVFSQFADDIRKCVTSVAEPLISLKGVFLICRKNLHIWEKFEMTHFTAAFDGDDAQMTGKMQGIFNELWKRAR